VQNEDSGFHLLGEINGALGVAQPLLVLAAIAHGGFKQIGGRLRDPRRQGAKIVGRADFDDALLDCTNPPWQQNDTNAMAEFGVRKPEIRNLAQHRVTVSVAVRIPAR
jgi:hypothetical protein